MSASFAKPARSNSSPGLIETRPEQPPLQAAGAFGATACLASDAGLVVVPCGGDSGKAPLIKWAHLRAPLRPERRNHFLANRKFFDANIGIATGPSGLTVIDCDTPNSLDQLLDRFGPTPLVIKTPRGGFHLYYRSAGEKCGPMREHNLAIDVKAEGGFVVAPPSVRPAGEHAGKTYNFEIGSWAELSSIPRIKTDGLPSRFYAKVTPAAVSSRLNRRAPGTGKADPAPDYDVGQRNTALFNHLRDLAQGVGSKEDLLRAALDYNERFRPPLGVREVRKTVASVWRYREEGRLFIAGSSTIVLPTAVYDRLAATPNGADAQMLLLCLVRNHKPRSSRGEDFSIAAAAMARNKVILGWGIARYRKAVQTLLQANLITITHRGGRHRADPHLYRLT